MAFCEQNTSRKTLSLLSFESLQISSRADASHTWLGDLPGNGAERRYSTCGTYGRAPGVPRNPRGRHCGPRSTATCVLGAQRWKELLRHSSDRWSFMVWWRLTQPKGGQIVAAGRCLQAPSGQNDCGATDNAERRTRPAVLRMLPQ